MMTGRRGLILDMLQGDGVPPAEAREFCEWLQGTPGFQGQAPAFSVCALGDRCTQKSRHALNVVPRLRMH